MNTQFEILPFAYLLLKEHCFIATINEGVTIRMSEHLKFLEVIKTHFKNNPFVYIANRKHSYSVDVMLYPIVQSIPNLLGEAIVTHNDHDLYTFEHHFFDKKPFKKFQVLQDAIDWGNSLFID